MLRFVNESIPTSLAEDKHKLFVNFLLQLFRVRLLNLFQQLFHGVLALLIGVQDHTIKIGKDFNLDHIDQTSVWKFCPASHALPFFNHPSNSDLKLILLYSYGQKELNLQKKLILLGDSFTFMIGSDFIPSEVPPHPDPPPPRGEGWVGEDHSCFFINIEV